MRSDALMRTSIPRQSHALVDEAALTRIVTSVWRDRLATRVKPLLTGHTADFVVSAALPISRRAGRDNLIAMLCASERVAVSATVATLGLRPGELAPADINDTFAGLVQAIGDAISSRLGDFDAAGPAFVVHGSGLGATVPDARLVGEAWLGNAAGPLYVSLWSQRARRTVLVG